MQEITPVSIQEVKPEVYVFDLGQNIAGYCRLQIAGPAGTEVKLKHGEKLYEDGTVEQKQILRFLKTGEAQTDRYILKGEGIETWQPHFVYHGFQYVEVTGLPVKPTKEILTGIVVYTSFEKADGFACSNLLFNQLIFWHKMPITTPSISVLMIINLFIPIRKVIFWLQATFSNFPNSSHKWQHCSEKKKTLYNMPNLPKGHVKLLMKNTTAPRKEFMAMEGKLP